MLLNNLAKNYEVELLMGAAAPILSTTISKLGVRVGAVPSLSYPQDVPLSAFITALAWHPLSQPLQQQVAATDNSELESASPEEQQNDLPLQEAQANARSWPWSWAKIRNVGWTPWRWEIFSHTVLRGKRETHLLTKEQAPTLSSQHGQNQCKVEGRQ